MLRTLDALFGIRTASAVNRCIYYAARLPWIGPRIPDRAYASPELKRALAVLVWAAMVLWGFIGKLGYVGLLVFLPAAAMEDASAETQLSMFLHVFVLLSFAAAGVSMAVMLEPKREKYIAVKLMRMPPGAYMRITLAYRYGMFLIGFVPALALWGGLLGLSFVRALELAAVVTLWRVLCEYVHLRVFTATGMVLIRNNAFVWTVIALSWAGAYGPFLLGWEPGTGGIVLSWPVALLIAAAGIWAAVGIARHPDYRTVVDAAAKRDDPLLDLGRMMAEAQESSVRMKDSEYAVLGRQVRAAARKTGYAYLNALFFARHRKLVVQPVYKRLVIIGGLAVFGVAVGLSPQADRLAFLSDNLEAVFPFLLLAMNFLTVGEQLCRAMYYHCDNSLLRYSFYRKAASRHFRQRLARIAGWNMLIGAALSAALTLTLRLIGGTDAPALGMLWMFVLSLALFFSVHHLAMYYLFQPYSTEWFAKNPFYHLVTLAVSAACGFGLVLRPPIVPFTAVVFTVSVVYLAAALALVGRYGPRTFRVK